MASAAGHSELPASNRAQLAALLKEPAKMVPMTNARISARATATARRK